jgi:sortase (surface protein transpeptidase)
VHTRTAITVLVVSVAALVATGAAWFGRDGATERVDLAGAVVTTTTTASAAPTVVREATPGSPATEVPAAGTPVRLTIPSIGVETDIDPVGIEVDGSMELPEATRAGWFRYGPRPGDPDGSAVVAAHVNVEDTPGAFYSLTGLEPGSEVLVTDRSLVTRTFVVTERFQVDKADLPATELFRSDGPAVLTLVTCGGAFDDRSRRYADNIVVRAVPA